MTRVGVPSVRSVLQPPGCARVSLLPSRLVILAMTSEFKCFTCSGSAADCSAIEIGNIFRQYSSSDCEGCESHLRLPSYFLCMRVLIVVGLHNPVGHLCCAFFRSFDELTSSPLKIVVRTCLTASRFRTRKLVQSWICLRTCLRCADIQACVLLRVHMSPYALLHPTVTR